MGAIVDFNYSTWIAQFPEFATVDEDVARGFWTAATMFWANDGSGPIGDPDQQTRILNLVTAHLAALSGYPLGPGQVAGTAGPTGLVGRVASVSQGPVSISTDIGTQSANAAYWWQTTYGAQYWQLTMAFRLARWLPAPATYPNRRIGWFSRGRW